MSRRKAQSDDSLELLLDPICNMFGTIMFVALIAALLAMARSGIAVDEAVTAAEQRIESRTLQLEARAVELEAMLSELPAADGVELDAAAAERAAQALGEISRRVQLIELYEDTVRMTRDNIGSAASQIAPMKAEIGRVQAAVESARELKDRKARTPIEREVGLFEFTVIIWQDRLYAVCDLRKRPTDACEWLRAWNNRYVVAARCSTPIFRCTRAKIHISRSIVLREDAGIPISDAESLLRNSEFRSLLATLIPADDLIGIVVAPDSFDSFMAVKQAFLAEGFNYSVEPCEQQLPQFEDSWIPGRPRGL